MNPAPIALFVYNRVSLTKNTIESLKRNFLADQSDLFIFSDGPKRGDDEKKVLEVRKILRGIKGFKKVEIIERDANAGLSRSIINGVTDIVNMRERAIVLEDDLAISPYFLKFMNEALELYKDDDIVSSICGFFYGINEKVPETFFLKTFSSYGWATWKRAWKFFEEDGKRLMRKLEELKCGKAFDLNDGYPYMRTLKKQSLGLTDAWAVRWYASSFLRNSLNLYPCRSLTDHVGVALDSTHNVAPYAKLYAVNMSERPIKIEKMRIEEDQYIVKLLERHMKKTMPGIPTRAFFKLQRFFRAVLVMAKNIFCR